MRKFILLTVLLFLPIIITYTRDSYVSRRTFPKVESVSGEELAVATKKEVHISTPDPLWDKFIEAVIWRESKGNERAIGDGGKAVGVLQIHPIMVREANRILAMSDPSLSNHYTYDDRYSREKSIEMFKVVQGYHNKSKDHKKALDIWNHNHPKEYETSIFNRYNILKAYEN